MQQARPHFLGIGAPKAGTSWLWSQLKKHPDIWLTPQKEIHFFDRSTEYPSPNKLATASFRKRLVGSNRWERPQIIKGLAGVSSSLLRFQFPEAAWWSSWTFGYYDENWYVNLFSSARPGQLCGEITPSYSILDPKDIARIKAINPEMRLIFLIRDPIDRAWSGLRFSSARGAEELKSGSTGDLIARLKSPLMILRGDYERTLENYLEFFDSSQILVCFYDAISRDPEALIRSITLFLGIHSFAANTVDAKTIVNPSPKREMPEEIREYLLEEYAPMISRLSKRFGGYASTWEARYGIGAEHDISSAAISRSPTVHP
jgi:hypothetical protein